MRVLVDYGASSLPVDVPPDATVVEPHEVPPLPEPRDAILRDHRNFVQKTVDPECNPAQRLFALQLTSYHDFAIFAQHGPGALP